MEYKNKSVLISGGAGSFGQEFTGIVLREHDLKVLWTYSSDELLQHEIRQKFKDGQMVCLSVDEARFTTTVEVFDKDGNACAESRTGNTIRVRATFRARQDTIIPNFGFAIRETASRAVITVADARTSDLPDVLTREGIVECLFENMPLRSNPHRSYLIMPNLECRFLAYNILDEVDTGFIVVLTKDDFTDEYRGGQNDLVRLPFYFKLQLPSETEVGQR